MIRFILLLISCQFFSLAMMPGEVAGACPGKHQRLQTEHAQAFSLSVFFEESKTEKEGEEEKLLHCFEIADLSFASMVLTRAHTSQSVIHPTTEQRYDLRPPLFTLHRTFLI